jgi:hypothetical protein
MAVVTPLWAASWQAVRKLRQLTSGSVRPRPCDTVILETQNGQRAVQASDPATMLKVWMRMAGSSRARAATIPHPNAAGLAGPGRVGYTYGQPIRAGSRRGERSRRRGEDERDGALGNPM